MEHYKDKHYLEGYAAGKRGEWLCHFQERYNKPELFKAWSLFQAGFYSGKTDAARRLGKSVGENGEAPSKYSLELARMSKAEKQAFQAALIKAQREAANVR